MTEPRPDPPAVHVVAPRGIDDPAGPSGGNIYDRRLFTGLRAAGWTVCEHLIGAQWPESDQHDIDQLTAALSAIPAGATVIVDGLIASAAADVMHGAAARLRLAVLMHLPFGVLDADAQDAEAAMLAAVRSVIATSAWTRDWLAQAYGLDADRIAVAEPGVDPAPPTRPSATGSRLLCVAAILPNKGQDILLEALAGLVDLDWTCVFAGATDRDPRFAASLLAAARSAGIEQRLRFVGPLGRAAISAAYGEADLVVAPSRHETFGMVITEALAAAVPVVAADVGGTRLAMGAPDGPLSGGQLSGGDLPGWLAPSEDPATLSAILRRWLTDPSARERARRAAARRRDQLPGWDACAASVGRALNRA